MGNYLALLGEELRVLGNTFGGPIKGPFVSFSPVSIPATHEYDKCPELSYTKVSDKNRLDCSKDYKFSFSPKSWK